MAASIGAITRSKINRILADENESRVKREIAELERGVGKMPGELPDLWGHIFEDFPEEYMSRDGSPSKEELAYYTALTLFAAHQRGRNTKKDPMHTEKVSLGQAMRTLAGPDTQSDAFDRIRKRFNICASAADFQSLSVRLRGLVHYMKGAGVALDYGKLADDLFFFQFPGSVAKVRLRWGQDFYRTPANTEAPGEEAVDDRTPLSKS